MRSPGWEHVAAINIGPRFERGQELSGGIVGGRFRIGALANVGGMGFVYVAEDLARSGIRVAFKVMLPISRPDDSATKRFFREAEVLSTLQHPGIVQYVAHGLTHDERPYLAMEWLDGEELEQLLARERLPIGDALSLLRKVTDALAFAHDHGITHRDLKPSNIFLRNGSIENPVLLDFGVARWLGHTMQFTRTGMLIGTPGYMAPEQARGQSDIGPSADVFALGCLLYQCLVGKPPFTGDHITAVLAKVLFEEVQPLRAHRADLPASLDSLISRMLAKNPADRPPNARALLTELDAVTFEAAQLRQTVSTLMRKAALTEKELSLYCLVLASPERTEDGPDWEVSNATIRAPFLGEAAWPRHLLDKLGVQLESMADGSVAIVIGKGASAKDQAAMAARCALLLLERNPAAQVILATGRGAVGADGGVPQGEVFERASALLKQRAEAPSNDPAQAGVFIDEITASVLGPGYDISRAGDMLVLTRTATNPVTSARPPTNPNSCVGRERELGQLISALDAVIEDVQSAAAIVTAVPGMGKSRLLHAFLDRVVQERPNVVMLHGHGDPGLVHVPFGVLGQTLRDFVNIGPDDLRDEQRNKLETRLRANLPKTNRPIDLEPVIDMALRAFDDDAPKPITSLVENAFLTWLLSECAVHPMLLSIDDAHWLDEATTRVIDHVLRIATDVPLFVVTIHRSTSEVTVPWHTRAQELRLTGIGKRAAERFVRSTLGADTPMDTVTRLVRDAVGNPLILEQLVRAEMEAHRDDAPQTLRTILQARMQHLSSGARRTLRAASLFGPTFWKHGVAYVLGVDPAHEESVSRWIEELLDAELVTAHPESRFAADMEYGFSSAHVREAAYGLLTDADRELGRALVERFLSQAK